jgi:hypothetical protein
MVYALTVAKYATLVALAFYFWFLVGHGHSWVFAAVMLAAIRNEHAHSTRWVDVRTDRRRPRWGTRGSHPFARRRHHRRSFGPERRAPHDGRAVTASTWRRD